MKQIFRLVFAMLFTLIALHGSAQKSKVSDSFLSFDSAFARVLKEWHAAGFAVAVVQKDRVIYAKGFGYKDYEQKIPATPNTLFAIGSCTKAFTASLLGMLNKDGKVDFDKPVRTYLPKLQFFNDEMTDKITLRDMMSHRTGLPRHDYSWYLFTTLSRDSLMQRIRYMEPSAGLREKWQYNNFMFLLQGMVTETITGKSWEQNIREKIFGPLAMTSSTLSIDELVKNPEAALGYDVKKDSLIHKMDYYHIDAMAPAGSINSSVLDMAKWVSTWIEGGKSGTNELLPPAYVAQASGSQMVISGALPEKENPDVYLSNYGLGWFISSYRGHYRVEHGGNIDGFSASTCFFPSDSIGIIVLCNQNGSAVPSVVRNLIADKLLGLTYKDWETILKKASEKSKALAKEAEKSKITTRKTGTTPSHALKDYAGVYQNKAYGPIELSVQHDSLFAQVGTHTWWLRHYHYDMFEPFDKDPKDGIDTADRSDPMQFQMNIAGDIESLTANFEPSIKPIEFVKVPKAKMVSRDSLQKYEGDYLLGTITIKVYLKAAGTLYLFVPGQPEYELLPTDTDLFSIKILSGFSVKFLRDDKGNVNELLSIQPNGTFKAIRKK